MKKLKILSFGLMVSAAAIPSLQARVPAKDLMGTTEFFSDTLWSPVYGQALLDNGLLSNLRLFAVLLRGKTWITWIALPRL